MPASEHTEPAPNKSLSDIGQLLNDVTCQITDNNINFPAQFKFIWHNIQFTGRILRSENEVDQYCLNLVADLGYIPFSSENFLLRKKLLKLFTPLFMKGDYSLSENSHIQMVLMTNFSGPANARRLVEVITYTLFDLHVELKSIQSSILS
ncbi:MAG: hypothetical protein KAI89_04220 [Emcibacter sp.]|nr:hypothetical protein [Emcibacter sp.]